MALNQPESGDGRRFALSAAAGRLAESRWQLAAIAVLVALAVVLTGMMAVEGLVLFLLATLLTALVPRATGRRREEGERPQPAGQIWPDTGVKLFAEALPDPCIILDRRGIVRYANRRAVEAFAIKAGDPLTFRLRVPDLLAAFDRVAKGGGPERVEFVERLPTERWFAASFARFDDSDQANGFIALVLDDLTEGKRSERIRVDFVANASHELRTPLASLSGFIETLQGPARDDAAARERFLKIMQDQATRMSRLIDDLLSLSRIEMKAHVKPSGVVDLVATAKHVVDALEPLARELGVTIAAELPPGSVRVTGDRDELIQVIENLIENACKYGQSGGRVEVRVEPAGDGAGPSFSVRDFGPGIAEEHIPRLTERFYRIDLEASRKHRGTGLGLAIVKHILARHQARMSIESRLGEGAVFTVTFPQSEVRNGAGQEDDSFVLPVA
jgi:two-component system phosphate regulon sensor histidine kinase PhoR